MAQENKNIDNVYFLGIGGIGMSALARYYKSHGLQVAGYDRVATPLTTRLMDEGIEIHFVDSIELVPDEFLNNKKRTLVVYTPAVPADHTELNYFLSNGFQVVKRAEALGFLTSDKIALAIAGTHGKTTTTTLTAHLLKQSDLDCNAFLGGISINYDTNLLLAPKSKYVVVEADEFDRSFLQLNPTIAVITSVDADHLDIYETHDEIISTFNRFINQIKPDGSLIMKKGLPLNCSGNKNIKTYTYSLNEEASFYAKNIHVENGFYHYDLVTPNGIIENLKTGTPGLLNVENSVAAAAMAILVGLDEKNIRKGLESFKGVKRRFEFHIRTPQLVYIDDYAHHPEEIKFCIRSIRELYPKAKLTGIFQPHLFSRTRDLADDFARALSSLDELILLDIYPAREEPIEGVTSELILDKVTLDVDEKIMCPDCELLEVLRDRDIEVLVTMGAGDIEKYVMPVKRFLQKNYHNLLTAIEDDDE